MVNPLSNSAKKAEEAAKTIDGVLAYVEETARDFRDAENIAIDGIANWAAEHKVDAGGRF